MLPDNEFNRGIAILGWLLSWKLVNLPALFALGSQLENALVHAVCHVITNVSVYTAFS